MKQKCPAAFSLSAGVLGGYLFIFNLKVVHYDAV